MKQYAGIGSRQTPADVLQVMTKVGQLLATDGFGLRTGACIGPDQDFANGAATERGFITLLLPWGSYEAAWVRELHMTKADIHVRPFNKANDKEAIQSVKDFHPAFDKLKDTVVALHARNYLILMDGEEPVEFIICYTPGGVISGGTGQALRLAESKGITVYNLGNPLTLAAFVSKIKARDL